LRSIIYRIEELSAKEAGGRSAAPLIECLPDAAEGRGRSGVKAGPITVAAGSALPLTLSVTGPPSVIGPGGVMDADDDEERPYIRNGKTRTWWMVWDKHQGPGDVTYILPSVDLGNGDISNNST